MPYHATPQHASSSDAEAAASQAAGAAGDCCLDVPPWSVGKPVDYAVIFSQFYPLVI